LSHIYIQIYGESEVLQNGEDGPLSVAQVAEHLAVKVWNVTRELQLGTKQNEAGRLRGHKVRQNVGRGGQWRVDRETYLNWLGIPPDDRGHLGPDGLPELIPFAAAAEQLQVRQTELSLRIRAERWPHITFGRMRYLTHNQLERLRVQLIKDCREATPGGRGPDASVT
jgi:hypothetical protein